jgi:hypothetical protein
VKKNITLSIALLIPVLMLVFIVASIYIPGLLYKPQYNFLYAVGNGYCSYPEYIVKNARVMQNQDKGRHRYGDLCTYKDRTIQFYIYDVTTDQNTLISLMDAERLTLNESEESPDGFSVRRRSRGGWGLPFFGSGGDFNTYYLLGHNTSHKLNLYTNNEDRYSSVKPFLGWIVNEHNQ